MCIDQWVFSACNEAPTTEGRGFGHTEKQASEDLFDKNMLWILEMITSVFFIFLTHYWKCLQQLQMGNACGAISL